MQFLPTYLPYFFSDRYRKQTIFLSWPHIHVVSKTLVTCKGDVFLPAGCDVLVLTWIIGPMIGAEVRDIEVAETVIDVAIEGAVFAVVYTVH